MGLCAAHRAHAPIKRHAHQQLLSGTHKNLQRLVFAQSIQLSNIVLGESPLVVGRWRLAKTYAYDFHPARVCGYGSYSVRGVQTPHFLQPNVRRQNDFHWTVN
jgi:hypothetical protein